MDLPVRDALEALGVRHLLLGVHDPAFPTRPDEDIGRGTPYGRGGDDLIRFAGRLGFTGLQLGPQGLVSEGNASPYDGTLFSRNAYSIALAPLTEAEPWCSLLSRERLAETIAALPSGPRVAHVESCRAVRRLVGEAWRRLPARSSEPGVAALAERLGRFRVEADWLDRDVAFAGGEWPHEVYAFAQFVAHEQHATFRRRAREVGLSLYGDLQIGVSHADAAARHHLFLPGYLMGAPPSRTNPEGQPWGYPVLDPELYRLEDGTPGPALVFLLARLDKVFTEYDSIRIDHPHGMVCPWVYRTDRADAHAAVREGARLFDSPDLPDHPALSRYAIARADQLRRDLPRYADGWVRDLDDAQVERYAVLFDALVATARRHGRAEDVACEVLSTMPFPLDAVRCRHGLGRFRITEKVGLDDPSDVYRTENARPEDWVMLGTHDTPPIWGLAEEWVRSGAARLHADYLAWRLVPEAARRADWAARVATDPRELAQAKLAELFVGPARQAMVFFTDLFGFREPYNRPGTVDPSNWALRIPADFEAVYEERRRRREALDLGSALATAIAARGESFATAHAGLLDRLAS